MNWAAVAAVGVVVGFAAGMFGKGGSAIATPLLHAVGVPAIVAVAAPLPAAIPSTVVAYSAYRGSYLVDRQVLIWSVGFGVPATVAGAVATRWISGGMLVQVTDVIILGLGLRFVVHPGGMSEVVRHPGGYPARLAVVATAVGLVSGLLANSGGFLLAPLYVAVLRLPLKTSFACSLVVAAVLAIPGTIVHAALGHIDWAVVGVFGAASTPLSYVGARVAIAANPARLERIYGALLTLLGAGFLILNR